jgi:hypothetical protein
LGGHGRPFFMLKEINPLNVFGLRRVEHAPPHFESVVFDLRVPDRNISNWIYANLDGRFHLGEHYYIDDNDRVQKSWKAAFEIHSEASYFGLFLDRINRSEFDW